MLNLSHSLRWHFACAIGWVLRRKFYPRSTLSWIAAGPRIDGNPLFHRFHEPRIIIKNECHRAIDVIVYYLAGKNEPQTWQTRGWFNLASGQKKYVADNHNRYVYFYGETQQNDKLIWAGDFSQWFEGKRYGFFKVDTGTNLVDFTQTFTCD